jgi:DNA-binding FrmR family transcriptional regulator
MEATLSKPAIAIVDPIPPAANLSVPRNDARKGLAVEAEVKSSNLKRLARIEGQVRGIRKMVEDDRECADIMVQISAVQEALRGVARELMRSHLKHQATDAFRAPPEDAGPIVEELVELMYRHAR